MTISSRLPLTREGVFESYASHDGRFVYSSKGRGINGRWRVNADGTNAQAALELADADYWRAWLATLQGLY